MDRILEHVLRRIVLFVGLLEIVPQHADILARHFQAFLAHWPLKVQRVHPGQQGCVAKVRRRLCGVTLISALMPILHKRFRSPWPVRRPAPRLLTTTGSPTS